MEDCQFSARGHAGAVSRGNELFVLEGLAASYLLNSRSQNDLGGGPRTTRRYSAADAVTTQFDGLPHPPGKHSGSPEHTRQFADATDQLIQAPPLAQRRAVVGVPIGGPA